MPNTANLKGTFDTAVSVYEKFRPGYVDELYQRIFSHVSLGPTSRAVEIGIGAGQATLPILRTGCRVKAVEYGENFSALCRKKFQDYPNFLVLTGKFEDALLEEASCDLVYSATAFHWIPEEIGYPKVFSILKKGGVFARFANHPLPDKSNPVPLSEEIDALYEKYMGVSHPAEFCEEKAKELSEIALRYGFEETSYALYHRTRTFTARDYIGLLGTYSDHIALEESRRKALFTGIEQAIQRYGGTITLHDTIDLELAKKPE